MKRKIIASFMTVMLIGVSIMGCGSSNTAEGEGADNAEGAETTTSGAQLESGTVTLRVWGAEEDQALLGSVVESFKQEYAGMADFDITVEVQSEAECKNVLLGDPLNGADVFTFVDDQLMTMVAAGVLEPVDNADAVKSANTEGSIIASTVNDILYAYPMTADNGYFMYYDKTYFSESDVQTLDGMLAIAAENGKKITMDWSSGWYLYSFFGNTGLEVGLNEDGISNYCTWNATDGAIKGVDVAEAMLSIASNPAFLNGGDDALLTGVADGSVIAGVSGVWNATAIREVWGNEYGAVKLPTYTCAGQQVQMSSFSGYKMVGVNAYSAHTGWALKLADWITNEQNQTIRFAERAQGPSNLNAANTDAVQSEPAILAILEQSEYASLQRIGGNYWDPIANFGLTMANGNPDGANLQELMDKMVENITALN